MSEHKYMLEWDGDEPMLTAYRENGRYFNEQPLSFDDARDELIRFWRDRASSAQEELEKFSAMTEEDALRELEGMFDE